MKKTVFLTNRQIGYTIEAGTFTITINSVQLADLEFSDADTAAFFDLNSGDKATLFAVDISVENTSDETLAIYPDQSTIVTSTKEQVSSELFLSDNVGGDFLGQVIKSGQVYFLAKNSSAADISSIKWYIDAPLDSNWDKMCEDIVIDFCFDK